MAADTRATIQMKVCVGAELRAGRVPDIPATCEPEWAFLLSKCLQPHPVQRWPMRRVASYLEHIIDTLDAQNQVRHRNVLMKAIVFQG